MTDLTIEEIKTGKVKVRAGYDTRILATDLGGTHPVCIAFKGSNGWRVLRLTEKGKQSLQEDRDYEYDLVRIPQPQYFNIYTYENGVPKAGSFYNDLEALVSARKSYVAMPHAHVKSFETFQYLDGDITKVEESSNAD